MLRVELVVSVSRVFVKSYLGRLLIEIFTTCTLQQLGLFCAKKTEHVLAQMTFNKKESINPLKKLK